MDWQTYIASGILESFVLGELSESEANEVLNVAKESPEVQAELNRIEFQMEQIAMNNAIEPSLSFDQILSSVAQDSKVATKPEETSNLHSQLVNTERRLKVSQRWAMAASIATLIFGGLALNYFNKFQSLSGDLALLQTQQDEYASELNLAKEKANILDSELNILRNSDFSRIQMGGTENSPNAQVLAYWNQATSELYLSIANLQALSSDQQFQLWSLKGGVPVSQGVFDGTETGSFQLENASGNIDAFAVTIEPRGGSTSPTLSTMQVYGEVKKS